MRLNPQGELAYLSTRPDARISPALWIIIGLMFVSVTINYIDRGSLSTAAPLLVTEIVIPPAKLGWLLSAFFWTYALFQIASGALVDRYGVKWVMALGFTAWCLATGATGLAHSFGILLALRLLLGVGESVAYPCYSKLIAAYFPEQNRGVANSVIDAGTKLGPALGALAGGMLMARWGWRPVFILMGLGGLIWLPAWFKWLPREQAPSTGKGQAPLLSETSDGPGFAQILSQRAAWVTIAGHFSGNYFWYFLLTWLPFYLVRERGFSMDQMAQLTGVAYCVTAVATMITGWLADRAIAGATPTRIRKLCAASGLTFAAIVVAVVFVHSSTGAMVLLLLACLGYGVFASSHWAIPQTIAGPTAVGKWCGVQNCIANMSGVVAPAITGMVVARTGHFLWAFVVTAGVVLAGAAAYAFVLGPVEPIIWPEWTSAE